MTKVFTALAVSVALAGPAAALTAAPLGPVLDDTLTPTPLGESQSPKLMPLPAPFPGWILPDQFATPNDFLA